MGVSGGYRSGGVTYKEIPKLSKEVIDLIKDFPNYYGDHDKI